jgi:hypothetical protein
VTYTIRTRVNGAEVAGTSDSILVRPRA